MEQSTIREKIDTGFVNQLMIPDFGNLLHFFDIWKFGN